MTEAVRKKQLAEALEHCGRIDLDLDQETLQKLRSDHKDQAEDSANPSSS